MLMVKSGESEALSDYFQQSTIGVQPFSIIACNSQNILHWLTRFRRYTH